MVPFSVGTTIIYYNRLTGSPDKAVLECFKLLTRREVENLEVNDTVWVLRDGFNYTGRGDIKGYVKVQVLKVRFVACPGSPERQKHFSYNSRTMCGFTAVDGALQHEKFWRADERSLENLIQESTDRAIENATS